MNVRILIGQYILQDRKLGGDRFERRRNTPFIERKRFQVRDESRAQESKQTALGTERSTSRFADRL